MRYAPRQDTSRAFAQAIVSPRAVATLTLRLMLASDGVHDDLGGPRDGAHDQSSAYKSDDDDRAEAARGFFDTVD